jgi:hypothetical protein
MQNDIQVLNNILVLTLKREIENLDNEGIYIPSLKITFDVKIEPPSIEFDLEPQGNEFIDIRTEKIEPINVENKILIEYIIKELESKLKEFIKKGAKKTLTYTEMLENPEYYIPNLKVVIEIDTLIIDKKDVIMGDSKYSMLVPKRNSRIPTPIYKAVQTFDYYLPLTLKEIIQTLRSNQKAKTSQK